MIALHYRELAVKGWNWGTANFNGSVLSFEVGKHDAFEIPLPYVNHCNTAKNEVWDSSVCTYLCLSYNIIWIIKIWFECR